MGTKEKRWDPKGVTSEEGKKIKLGTGHDAEEIGGTGFPISWPCQRGTMREKPGRENMRQGQGKEWPENLRKGTRTAWAMRSKATASMGTERIGSIANLRHGQETPWPENLRISAKGNMGDEMQRNSLWGHRSDW